MPERSLRDEAEAEEIEGVDAVVTEAEAMDHNRQARVDEVLDGNRERIRELLEIDELADITDGEAWDETVAELSEQGEEELSDELSALVQRTERPYPSLVRIRFELEDELSFVPGQYVRITYGDEEPRVYSVASSPNADHMELCVRRVPGGELTPTLCDRAESGDELFVRGPFGEEFTLREPSPRAMVFVATGTGVAPFKSMIDYTFEEGRDRYESEPRDVWLFLGSSWEDHLPYHGAFSELAAEHEHFHYVPTLSRERYLSEWAGETEYVQRVLEKYVDEDRVDDGGSGWVGEPVATDVDARIDPGSMEAYVCGIGAMTESVTDVLSGLGLDEELCRVESYG
jgi:CDP-4-dehydro-6-deoxyglucose reductase